jgi:hypothetical protein
MPDRPAGGPDTGAVSDEPPHSDDGHLPSCGPDCTVGQVDPRLERALAEYDALLAGLSPEEEDDLLRRAWIDDDGGVHVRDLRMVAEAQPED